MHRKPSASPKSNKKKSEADESKKIHVGQDIFTFPNGDCYGGTYKAWIERSIIREGMGQYRTAEGDNYRGMWENDILQGEATIKYKDGAIFTGGIEDLCYSGPGGYLFPNRADITCVFIHDRPTGEVVLTDPLGHQWHGTAQQDGVMLRPTNRFIPAIVPRESGTSDSQGSSKVLTQQPSTLTKSSSVQSKSSARSGSRHHGSRSMNRSHSAAHSRTKDLPAAKRETSHAK